jgi:Fur family ferric uptake transcriptional regulator/Fur family peroxide stress response transcriptional regulator
MESYDILVKHNIKPSLQRIAILDYLKEHRTHPSAEDVYAALSPGMPTLSKTTVYSTLRLFADSGAILMLTIDGRNANFDYDTSQHAHFLCRKCGRIFDYRSPFGQSGYQGISDSGFMIEEAHVYYHGVCRDCLRDEI